jgi:arginase
VRTIVLVDAPSNLGLRPPEEGVVPGVYKLAGALRDRRLLTRLGAEEGGVVTPPRYRPEWTPGGPTRNEDALARYSPQLAERVGAILDDGHFPVVLGGDCSILLGNCLALRRRGRYGLAFVDGHSDFRHPGNAPAVGAVAGEDLALVTGRGGRLADLEGLRPLVRDEDVATLGIRDPDYVDELRSLGMAAAGAEEALERLERPELGGFWIHVDVDVLDAAIMPAVDTPEPDGLSWEEFETVVGTLTRSERAVGLELTIFDPDLDPDGRLADRLADAFVHALTG